ncbi:hypothetical protein Tco_1026511 [Tanacetum coccineum]
MLLCKQAEKGVLLQADWLEYMDEEVDEQELEAHYNVQGKVSRRQKYDSLNWYCELKKKCFADLEYVQSLEKEIDELEYDKTDFSNIYDLLLQECVSMCSYLHSLSDLDAYNELQCLYVHKVKECECLAKKLFKQTENVGKEVYNGLLRSFAKLEKHPISLELSLQ